LSKKIEIRRVHNEECGKEINALFVDDQLFDYLIEEDSLRSAVIYCNQNPHLRKAVHGDIMAHFVNSFNEFVGAEYTLEEIYDGIQAGMIDHGGPRLAESEE
jgi:hypothetical protein